MPKKVLFSESVITRIISESLLEATASEIHGKYYQDVPEQDYRQLVFADPTSNQQKDKMGKYGKWILNLYKQGKLKTGDIPELRDSLTSFDKFKNNLEKKDINQYRSVPELYNAIEPFTKDPNQATSKSDELRKTKQQGAEKVYEDEEWLVIVPKTEQAACLYGKGTKWCTAATDGNNMFKYYEGHGPLFININKRTGRKYQFHFDSKQFMDEQDNPIGTNIPGTIGMTQGLYNFYASNKTECPYAKILFRFGNFNFVFENEEDDTVVFYTFANEETNGYGWIDYNTMDSLTGDELFKDCNPFEHNVAPYKDKQNGINIMGRDGKPLFKKSLPGDGISVSAADFGGKIFKVYNRNAQTKHHYNILSIQGKYLFKNWLYEIFKVQDEIVCYAEMNGQMYTCTLDKDGNITEDWTPERTDTDDLQDLDFLKDT